MYYSFIVNVSSYKKAVSYKKGNDSLNALIIEKDPYIVQFFDPTARNDVYKLNDLKFEV